MNDPPQPRLREPTAPFRQAPATAFGASPMTNPREWRTWVRNLTICAAAGTFMAFVGAMETGAMPLPTRLAYWVPLMMAGAFLGHAMSALIARAPRINQNKWAFGALLTVGIAVPITFVVWAYSNVLFRAGMGPEVLPNLFASALVISAAMSAIMIAVHWPGQVTHAGVGLSPSRFLERLPPKLKGALLYAISAEDHYLRLHTSKGSDLILMRLADAIAELEGIEGAQTHRSWWVAREAVESTRREGERLVLVLKGGAEAPVSRPNMRPLREAGWF